MLTELCFYRALRFKNVALLKDKAPGIWKHAKKQGWGEEQYSHCDVFYQLIFQDMYNHIMKSKMQDQTTGR